MVIFIYISLFDMKIWIVWLPNVWKSTLFNALTKSYAAPAENFPFCTIEPNVGIVDVKDPRVIALSEMSNSQKTKSGEEYSNSELFNSFNYEYLQESIDNAIYNSYGLEAKRFLSQEYLETLGYSDSRFYEDFGVSRQGKVIVFQGGAPKDALKAE